MNTNLISTTAQKIFDSYSRILKTPEAKAANELISYARDQGVLALEDSIFYRNIRYKVIDQKKWKTEVNGRIIKFMSRSEPANVELSEIKASKPTAAMEFSILKENPTAITKDKLAALAYKQGVFTDADFILYMEILEENEPSLTEPKQELITSLNAKMIKNLNPEKSKSTQSAEEPPSKRVHSTDKL